MSFGPNPWQQSNWDWRAAGNFVFGGAGSGLIVFAASAGVGARVPMLVGAALVALGLLCVWAEIGRPWRALHVYFNPRTSWMSREAIVAPVLFAAIAAHWAGIPRAGWVAGALAIAYAYCQARILVAAKGIPAWREPRLAHLMLATGLAEGGGLYLLLAGGATRWAVFGVALALLARLLAWRPWRRRIRASVQALGEIDRAGAVLRTTALAALAGVAVAALLPAQMLLATVLQGGAGALAAVGGMMFKLVLITRAGFNQGFALAHLPVRGAARRAAGDCRT